MLTWASCPMTRILKALPAKRQNLFFSATMPREIRADQADHARAGGGRGDAGRPPRARASGHPSRAERRSAISFAICLARATWARCWFTAPRCARIAWRNEPWSAPVATSPLSMAKSQGRVPWPSASARSHRYPGRDRHSRPRYRRRRSARRQLTPNVPEDYVHRIGRTAPAPMATPSLCPRGGEFVRAIERLIGVNIPRETVLGFTSVAPPAPPPHRRAGSGPSPGSSAAAHRASAGPKRAHAGSRPAWAGADG